MNSGTVFMHESRILISVFCFNSLLCASVYDYTQTKDAYMHTELNVNLRNHLCSLYNRDGEEEGGKQQQQTSTKNIYNNNNGNL